MFRVPSVHKIYERMFEEKDNCLEYTFQNFLTGHLSSPHSMPRGGTTNILSTIYNENYCRGHIRIIPEYRPKSKNYKVVVKFDLYSIFGNKYSGTFIYLNRDELTCMEPVPVPDDKKRELIPRSEYSCVWKNNILLSIRKKDFDKLQKNLNRVFDQDSLLDIWIRLKAVERRQKEALKK